MQKGVNFNITATSATGGAIDKTRRGLRGLGREVAGINKTGRSWNRGLNANRRAVQQFGFQMSDFAIQIAGGQSAMLAFTQQGGQMLQFFGPAGAISAAFLAVFGSLAIAFTKSGQSLSDLLPLMGVLEGQVGGLVNAIRSLGSIMIDVANVIVNNLDTIIITAGVVIGYFGTKWVASMVAARIATMTFVGALTTLRTIMTRLGFTALIVGAGYLIERFLTLVKGAGSFGEALSLLADVWRAAVSEMDILGFALVETMKGVASSIVASFLRGFADISEGFGQMISDILFYSPVLDALGVDLSGAIGSVAGNASDIRTAADEYDAAASSYYASATAAANSATATSEAMTKLREAMAAGESERIDIRDWFTGGGDEDGGGGKGAADKAKKTAKEIETTFENMQKTIGQSMLASFKSLTQGTKSLADVALDTLTQIGDKMIDILMTPVIEGIAGNLAGGLLGGLGGLGANIPIEMPSFDGGGYTGSGPRTGGLDGRGGKLALLHPNETVIDHNKGQNTGDVNVHMTVNTPNADSFRKSQGQIQSEIARAAEMGARGN